ncbi:hypothetical protein Tco_0948436 [Tanacetum coccineum]
MIAKLSAIAVLGLQIALCYCHYSFKLNVIKFSTTLLICVRSEFLDMRRLQKTMDIGTAIRRVLHAGSSTILCSSRKRANPNVVRS